MKKIFILALMFSLFAAPSFAAVSISDAAGLTAGSETLASVSNKVLGSILSDQSRFACATFHTNGSKEFGTSSESTKIFSHTATSLTTVTASDTANFASWTPL